MKKAKQISAYPGPSPDDVRHMTDERVDNELERLTGKPRTLHGVDDGDEHLVAAHGDKDFDHIWTTAELKALRQRVHAWHRRCLKEQLLSAYITAWIATLSDRACWAIIEEFEKQKVALSERRYTSRDKLRERTVWAIYASEVRKALSQPPTEGRSHE